MTRTKKIIFCMLFVLISMLVFTACHQSGRYDITFDPQSGKYEQTGKSESIRKSVIEGMPLPEMYAPTRHGYGFTGFYDNRNLIKQYYDANMNPVRLWDKNHSATLYAGWTVNIYNITLDPDGGIPGTARVRAAMFAAMPAADAPSKKGFTFGGFFTEPNGKGDKYYNADMKSNASWNITADTTLYAYWLPQYTLYLDFDGGNYGTKTTIVTLTLPMPTSKVFAPRKDLYAFGGYYSQKEGQGIKYYNDKMESVRSWQIEPKVIDDEGTLEELRIFAYWIPSEWNTLPKEGTYNTYSIINELQLASISKAKDGAGDLHTFSGITFILENDVDFGSNTWQPIGAVEAFEGTFNGNNHKISYAIVSGMYQYSGLFGKVDSSGVIKNLTLDYFDVKMAYRYQYTEKDNDGNEQIVKINPVYAGGLVGYNAGKIYNCSTTTTINDSGQVLGVSDLNVGGLVGYNSGTIQKSYAKTNIRLTSTNVFKEDSERDKPSDLPLTFYAGGLVGRNSYDGTTCVISECYSEGTVIANIVGNKNHDINLYAGGFVGSNDKGNSNNNYATIQDCYSLTLVDATVSGGLHAFVSSGGFAGINNINCIITRSFATGNVTTDCTSEEKIPGVPIVAINRAGGFVGENRAIISYSIAKGDVFANNDSKPASQFSLGGFAGYVEGGVGVTNNCYRYNDQLIYRAGYTFDKPTTNGTPVSIESLNTTAFYNTITWTANGVWDCSNVHFDLSIYPKLVMLVDPNY